MLDYIIAPSTAPESSKLYITLLGLLSYHGANLKKFIGISSVHACSTMSGPSNATIWQDWLKKAMQERLKLDHDSEPLHLFGFNCLQVALLMLQHGAQPTPCIEDHISEEKCSHVPMAGIFDCILPNDTSKGQARVLFDLAIAVSTPRHRRLRAIRAKTLSGIEPHWIDSVFVESYYMVTNSAMCSVCSEIADTEQMHAFVKRCLDCDNDRKQRFCHSCATNRSQDMLGILLACEAVEGNTTPATNNHTIVVVHPRTNRNRTMNQSLPLLRIPDADFVMKNWYHKNSHELDGDAIWSMENEAAQLLAELRQSISVRDVSTSR